jgi:hypothetical protein
MRERPEHEWHTAADMPRLEVVPVEPRRMPRWDRFLVAMELYAPEDEDGVRQPGEGLITLEDARRMMGVA